MDAITVGLCAFALITALWGYRALWANGKTYDQRIAIIESWDLLEGDAYLRALDSFRSVSYRDHERELFWGRDPYRLYPHLQGVH